MLPTAPSLAQSESKARFFDRLYLNEGNKMHRFLYSLMKAEAVEGWTRLVENRDSLAAEFRDDNTIEPPFSFGQIDEAAIRREIVRIFETARADTKILYSLGRDRSGDLEQNWIIRWLLWHVFRYRDDRNVTVSKRTGSSSRNSIESDESVNVLEFPDVVDGQSTMQVAADASQRAVDDLGPPPSQDLDPDPDIGRGESRSGIGPFTRYDPVRDEFR